MEKSRIIRIRLNKGKYKGKPGGSIMAKYCKNCGQQLDDGALFCAGCGTQMEQQAGPAPMPQEAEPAPMPQEAEPAPMPQEAGPAPMPQEAGPAPMPQEQQAQYAPPPVPMQEQQAQYAPPPAQAQYTPAGQPGYPPQGGQAYAAPPKKGLSKKLLILIIIIAAVAVLVVVGIVAAGGATKAAAKKDFFELGPDKVPSVMHVLGETRDISGFSNVKMAGIETIAVIYKVAENQGDDMYTYAQALMNDYSFYNTNPFDFTGSSGGGFAFATNSVEEGYIITLTIDFDESGYTLAITRQEGTLTIYGNEEEEEPEVPVIEEEEEEDLGDPGPAGEEIDLIISNILAGGTSVEEAQGFAPDGVKVVSKNPDGSFVYRMTTDTQQALIEGAIQETVDIIESVIYSDLYVGIEEIQWDPDEFSEVVFLVTDEFFEDDNLSFFAVLAIGYTAPMVQAYMGYGLDSITTIYITDASTGDVIEIIYAPDDLLNLFG
jgi:hypothetical protein